MHKDFSAGNILFDRINERFHFSLLDTNALKWGKKISVERGCKNLGRLVGPPEFFESLGRHYADHRQADPQQCINLIKAPAMIIAVGRTPTTNLYSTKHSAVPPFW